MNALDWVICITEGVILAFLAGRLIKKTRLGLPFDLLLGIGGAILGGFLTAVFKLNSQFIFTVLFGIIGASALLRLARFAVK